MLEAKNHSDKLLVSEFKKWQMMHYLKKSFFYESQKSHNYSDYLICEADCKKLRKEAMWVIASKTKANF
jgi:hypothetical protein